MDLYTHRSLSCRSSTKPEKIENRFYVSSNGFTKDAIYEAERATFPITLVDADRLVELIFRYYDKFDIETRSMVPLKKLYWPITKD